MTSIVICCDGTWNTPDQQDHGVPAPTNVVRLYNALAPVDAQGAVQDRYYHPGVGTSGKWWDKAVGGSTGAGLDQNIMSAYQKLCFSYRPDADIYLFGFSRGAYTVRSLCGFIACCGLLKIDRLPPAEVWQRIEQLLGQGYRRKTETREQWDALGWEFHNPAGQDIAIHFVGVWDTVGALGIPDDMALLSLLDDRSHYTFHDTSLHPSVKHARHALAMDERRASFQPTLWTDVPEGSDMQQIWFPGVHSDVGGGYHECGLADGALQWMIDQASAHGLAFNKATRQIQPNYHDMLHDSCQGVFGLLPTQPRSIAHLLDKIDFHDSALKRQDDPPIAQSPYRHLHVLDPALPLTLDIGARLQWNETGVWLEAGRSYRFSASGEWLDGAVKCGPDGPPQEHWQPAGVGQLLGSALGQLEKMLPGGTVDLRFTRRHEQYPWLSLIGAIANGLGVDAKQCTIRPETFYIGAGCTYTPKASGYLYAYANDAWNGYGNNVGHVALRIG